MNMSRAGDFYNVAGNGRAPGLERLRSGKRSKALSRLRRSVDLRSEADRMIELICELYPVCRSITGDGLRQSLFRLGELIPLATHEVATGTAGLRLDDPQGMEHHGRLHQE